MICWSSLLLTAARCCCCSAWTKMAQSSYACCRWPVQVLLSKDEQSRQRVAAQAAELEAEVDLLKQFDHPNIVRYLVSSC